MGPKPPPRPDHVRITKTQRWLDLIVFLVRHHFPVGVDEVMHGVPAYRAKWSSGEARDRRAVRRMFERDKDDLRALGVPLETVPYHVEDADTEHGYRLSRRDFYLPYLRVLKEGSRGTEGGPSGSSSAAASSSGFSGELAIEADHARTAIDALHRVAELPGSPFRDAASSALRKLSFDLDLDDLAPAPVLHVPPPGEEDVRDVVRTLLDAVRDRKKASFTYRGLYRDAVTERTVAPYGLLFQHGHWYLIGHDDLRDDLRVFRLGRMEGLSVNARAMKTPDYEIPDDFDLQSFAGRRAWELGEESEPVLARVRFDFPASLWADRNDYGRLVEQRADGAAVRELEVHQVDPFLRWVLSQAGEAHVEGPDELRARYDDLVRRVAGIYSSSAEGS